MPLNLTNQPTKSEFGIKIQPTNQHPALDVISAFYLLLNNL